MARPSTRTAKVVSEICERLAQGESVRSICDDSRMPSDTTVYRWIDEDEAFREMYTRARAYAMERMADELLEIADDSAGDTVTDDGVERTNHEAIARARLRVDTRKWLMSKLAPKKYGDRVDHTHSSPSGGPIGFVVEFVKREQE